MPFALLRVPTLALVGAILAACGGAQSTTSGRYPLAHRCEVTHEIHDSDTVQSTITRDGAGWNVALTLRVQLGPSSSEPIEIHGVGRVTGREGERVCHVTEATSTDAQSPRFDEDVCLDEFESVADVIEDAESTARPGETVVQEVRLRGSRRRRHARRRHVVHVANFSERAEITRDPQGRVIRIARTTQQNGRENLQVSYPSDDDGHCLPME